MREIIERKRMTAKVLLVISLVLIALFIASFFPMAYIDGVPIVYFLPSILLVPMGTVGIIFLVCSLSVLNNYSYLSKKGLLDVADDITLDTPTLPRSKIYCGKKALYSKKARMVIPYSEIVWAHMYQRSVNGITVEKAIILYTAEGKKFSLPCDENEAKVLAGDLANNNSQIILGYGAEQKKRYREEYPQSQNPKKLAQKIWGIILIVLAVVFLTVLIINMSTAEVLPASLMIAALLVGGTVLLILGKRK